MYQPGTRWEYGVSTDVLGRLVEALSGQPRRVFPSHFRPLGVQDMAFHVPADQLDRAAQPWARPGGPPMTPRLMSPWPPHSSPGAVAWSARRSTIYACPDAVAGVKDLRGASSGTRPSHS